MPKEIYKHCRTKESFICVRILIMLSLCALYFTKLKMKNIYSHYQYVATYIHYIVICEIYKNIKNNILYCESVMLKPTISF